MRRGVVGLRQRDKGRITELKDGSLKGYFKKSYGNYSDAAFEESIWTSARTAGITCIPEIKINAKWGSPYECIVAPAGSEWFQKLADFPWVLAALKSLAEKGVILRDLKAEHVRLRRSSTGVAVKFIDHEWTIFLSQLLTIPRDGTFAGNPAYSPDNELLARKPTVIGMWQAALYLAADVAHYEHHGHTFFNARCTTLLLSFHTKVHALRMLFDDSVATGDTIEAFLSQPLDTLRPKLLTWCTTIGDRLATILGTAYSESALQILQAPTTPAGSLVSSDGKTKSPPEYMLGAPRCAISSTSGTGSTPASGRGGTSGTGSTPASGRGGTSGPRSTPASGRGGTSGPRSTPASGRGGTSGTGSTPAVWEESAVRLLARFGEAEVYNLLNRSLAPLVAAQRPALPIRAADEAAYKDFFPLPVPNELTPDAFFEFKDGATAEGVLAALEATSFLSQRLLVYRSPLPDHTSSTCHRLLVEVTTAASPAPKLPQLEKYLWWLLKEAGVSEPLDAYRVPFLALVVLVRPFPSAPADDPFTPFFLEFADTFQRWPHVASAYAHGKLAFACLYSHELGAIREVIDMVSRLKLRVAALEGASDGFAGPAAEYKQQHDGGSARYEAIMRTTLQQLVGELGGLADRVMRRAVALEAPSPSAPVASSAPASAPVAASLLAD